MCAYIQYIYIYIYIYIYAYDSRPKYLSLTIEKHLFPAAVLDFVSSLMKFCEFIKAKELPRNIGHQIPSDVPSHSRTGTSNETYFRYLPDVFFVCAEKSYEKCRYIQSLSERTFGVAKSQVQTKSVSCSVTIYIRSEHLQFPHFCTLCQSVNVFWIRKTTCTTLLVYLRPVLCLMLTNALLVTSHQSSPGIYRSRVLE